MSPATGMIAAMMIIAAVSVSAEMYNASFPGRTPRKSPGAVWKRRLFGHDTNEEAENCPCRDPMRPDDEESCYMPVCDPGYYKCCSECDVSTCVGEVTMTMSRRGILECIECYPGDFCKGCDRFERCDPVQKLEAEISAKRASQKNKAEKMREAEAEADSDDFKRMVSKKGTAEAYDCMTCREGKYPFLDYSSCVDDYREKCSEKYLRRCMNRCGSEMGASYEMTKCEEMKCLMFCAMHWSPECAVAFKPRCEFLKNPPTAEQIAITAANQDKNEIRVEEIEEFIEGCDVNCDLATPRATPVAGLLLLPLSLFRLLNQNL